MDIGDTIAPKSDQQGFDDFLDGPRTVTVSAVKVTEGDQPVSVELAEYPGRPFKPNKSMRRVLVVGWGNDSSAYVGRRLTLFGNPAVIWAGKPTGGVEIAAMSHLDKALSVPLTVTRGKKKNFTVKPLAETAPPATGPIPQPVRDTVESITDAGVLKDYFAHIAEQGAPAHVLNYVSAQIELKESK